MVSQRKLEANRRNALRSTGPKTPEGKAAVRHNALKHGLLAREVVMTTGPCAEDPKEFDRLHARLLDDLRPVGALEETLVETIAVTYWRKRRVLRVETAEIRRRYGVPDSEDVQPPATLSSLLASVAIPGVVPGGSAWALERTSSGIDQLLELVGDAHLAVQVHGHLPKPDHDRLLTAFGKEDGSVGYACWVYNSCITDRDTIAEKAPQALTNAPTPEECTQRLLDALAEECERLTFLRGEVAHREALQRDLDQPCLALPPPEVGATLLRYEAAYDRQLYKAIAELERLQRRREGQPVPPPISIDVSQN